MASEQDLHRLDDDGAPHVEAHVYSWEDIAAKLDNEGWPDGLTWFGVNEVPKEGRKIWAQALRLKKELDAVEHQLDEFLPAW